MTAQNLDESQLRAVLEAARWLVAEHELAGVLRRLLDAGRTLTGAQYAAIAIVEAGPQEPAEVLCAGPEGRLRDELEQRLRDAPALASLLGALGTVRVGGLDAIDELGASSDQGAAGAGAGLRSLLGVSIDVHSTPWGALYLGDERADLFGPGEEEAIGMLAQWAAIAVENARIHTDNELRRLELERSVTALEATFEIVRAVGGETQTERVLKVIADRSLALVGATGVFILLPVGPDFVVAAVAGDLPDTMAGEIVEGRTSIARKVLRTSKPARIRAADIPSPSRDFLTQFGVTARAALVVPLVFRGNNVGVIEAFDRIDGPGFTLEDEHRLQAAAASAATAVATAQTVQQERLHRSLQAAEEERGRWARELHDETLQGLGGLRMTLSSARRLPDVGALRGAIDGAVEQLAQEIANLRALITELRPASLDQLGLEPALDALFDRARKVYGLPVDAIVELDPSAAGRLDPDVETAIYRVVQESLNNASRHAGASRVRIEVLERDDEIHLRVADDGRGFDETIPSAGFGVLGMRERVTLVGGRLGIASGPGGTAVTATLPALRAQQISSDHGPSDPGVPVQEPTQSGQSPV